MHIIQVTSYYPPHVGGVEYCVKELSERLATQGYSIDVLTSNIGVTTSTFKQKKNLRIRYLPSIEFAHTPIPFSLFFRLLQLPKQSLIHLHVAQAYTPEIVFLVSKLRNIPYIAHLHLDIDPSGPFGFLLESYKTVFLQRVLRHAKRIICLSEEQKISIAKKYRIPEENITIIPNGVSDQFFTPKLFPQKKRPTILFVGRLSPQKNIPLFLQAIHQLHHTVTVEIVGDGEERKNIEALIERLHLTNVTLLGEKSGKELRKRYQQADVLVMTSRKEGLPLVLLEAMAAGLPIIATDIPGIHQTLADAGILVHPSNSQQLAWEIDRLLDNKNLRKALSQKARTRAQAYRWESSIAKVAAVYKEISKR